jgi:hypothetical protein
MGSKRQAVPTVGIHSTDIICHLSSTWKVRVVSEGSSISAPSMDDAGRPAVQLICSSAMPCGFAKPKRQHHAITWAEPFPFGQDGETYFAPGQAELNGPQLEAHTVGAAGVAS